MPPDAIVVGRVAGSYGIRGWLRVEPFNDPHDSVLLTARRWYLDRPSAATGVSPAMLVVSHCRVHGAALVASVAGIQVREAAEALRGCEILVSRTDFPPSDDDEYYWVDLIGCRVVTPADVELGTVESVDDHGAHPLLHVRRPLNADGTAGSEFLIPFVSAHVPEVDLAARRIVADWDPDF